MIDKINDFAPIINSLAVLGSFLFVIWSACWKTRRDRLDILKTEIRICVSQHYGRSLRPKDVEPMLRRLPKKYQEPKYKELQHPAFHEMLSEDKLELLFPRIFQRDKNAKD